MTERKVALITGASSGIGKAMAWLLAGKGYDLILVARRMKRLESLAGELESSHGIAAWPLEADLSKNGASQDIFQFVQHKGLQVDLLVNNAGFGVNGKFSEIESELNSGMIQVMIISLTELTRLFLPSMIARENGGILNVASIGGVIPCPGLAVYTGVKAYVVRFTDSLNMELKGTGVTATVLLPGPTRTELFDKAGIEETSAIKRISMSPEAVARQGYMAFEKGKPMVIAGCINRFQVALMGVLPRCLVVKIVEYYLK
jgi:hypothetical protein